MTATLMWVLFIQGYGHSWDAPRPITMHDTEKECVELGTKLSDHAWAHFTCVQIDPKKIIH